MPIATRTFRVFVSSTFEDLKEERDALQHDVFPKLRTLCEQHGARFQAIDLRWGVRDEAGLDQQTMEICLREIERCKCTGIKPNFIVLLGARYGWEPLPPGIPASEFAALRLHIPPGEVLTSADQWYRLDENAIPPKFCLQPRTGEFVDPAAWKKVEEMLHPALALAARTAALPARALLKYEASATHQEILTGLGESGADRQHVFGFFRRPSDGETNARLEDLKSYLRVQLPGNIEEFDRGETTKLCNDVLTRLRSVIEAEVKSFKDLTALDLEVESHNRFAEERCRVFTGRESVLDTIAEYLRADDRRPLVLRGESGSGKSAVMAKASKQYQGPGRMIRRFIGASPQSASGHALLTSLCLEIAPGDTPVDYAQLENAFKERLKMASAEQPLVVFIDALDQLSASDPAREATWLPSALPLHVKVIVSTTDDGKRLPEALLVQLERMGQPEGGEALDELLREARRTLQPWQRETVLTHFERCGLPLYLKLAAEESRLWKSYMPVDDCALGEGIAGVIDTLFARLSSNANHGPVLVQRSLAYLAAARYGLAEDEILDVLTEDDAVWNDFNDRKHHEVSERRLPVVVWSRLSLDLEPYLTERAAPGGTVISFYHAKLAVRALVSEDAVARHATLAAYFAQQAFWLDSNQRSPNRRQLIELPYQLNKSKQWNSLLATLTDLSFLTRKIMAFDLAELIEDCEQASAAHEDRRIDLLTRSLRQISHHFSDDKSAPKIASCLHIRLKQLNFLNFRSLECPPFVPFLGGCSELPDTPPESLLYTIHFPGHGLAIDALSSRVAAGSGSQLTVRSLRSGVEEFAITAARSSLNYVAFSPDGHSILGAIRHYDAMWGPSGEIHVWHLEKGSDHLTVDRNANHALITADGEIILTWMNGSGGQIRVWDARTGKALHSMTPARGIDWRNLMVITTPDSSRAIAWSGGAIAVYNLRTANELYRLNVNVPFDCNIAVSPDSRYFVTPSAASVVVRDLSNGIEVRELRTTPGVTAELAHVNVSPDSRLVSAVWRDTTVALWELDSGTLRFSRQFESGSLISARAVFQHDARLVLIQRDTFVKALDVETGEEVYSIQVGDRALGDVHVFEVAVSQDDAFVVTRSNETLQVWKIQKEKIPHKSAVAIAGTEWPKWFGFDDNGRVLMARYHRDLKVWNVETKAITLTSDATNMIGTAGSDTVDFEWAGGNLRVLDVLAHSEWTFRSEERVDSVHAVALSVDRTLVAAAIDIGGYYAHEDASGYTDYTSYLPLQECNVIVWNIGSRLQKLILRGHSDRINDVAIRADNRLIVTVSNDCTLRVWDADSGCCVSLFSAAEVLYKCTWHPDGRQLVAIGPHGIYWLRWIERFDGSGGESKHV